MPWIETPKNKASAETTPLVHFAISTPPVAPESVSKHLRAEAKRRLTESLLDVTVNSKLSRGQGPHLCASVYQLQPDVGIFPQKSALSWQKSEKQDKR